MVLEQQLHQKKLTVEGDISASGDIIIEGNISSSNTGNNFIAGNTKFSRATGFFPTHLIHLSGSDEDGALIRVQGNGNRVELLNTIEEHHILGELVLVEEVQLIPTYLQVIWY